jgi:hypothetical protein
MADQHAELARPVDIAKKLAEALIHALGDAEPVAAEVVIPVFAFDHVKAVVIVKMEA